MFALNYHIIYFWMYVLYNIINNDSNFNAHLYICFWHFWPYVECFRCYNSVIFYLFQKCDKKIDTKSKYKQYLLTHNLLIFFQFCAQRKLADNYDNDD